MNTVAAHAPERQWTRREGDTVVEQQGRSGFTRRRAMAVTVAAASLVLAGCASGQVTQTVNQKGAVDGTSADSGTIGIRFAGFETPQDGKNWPSGSNVPLQLVIVNNGTTDDTLTGVTSPASDQPATVSGSSVTFPGNPADNVDTTPLVIKAGRSVSVGLSDKDAVVTFRDVKDSMFPAQSMPVTFVFSSGRQINTYLSVKLTDGAQPGPTLEVRQSGAE